VLSFGGVPTILEDIWLPGGPFKGLTAERLSADQGPMYALFETEFGVRMVKAEERIKAVVDEIYLVAKNSLRFSDKDSENKTIIL
jgi:GntR family transcriptional regulator